MPPADEEVSPKPVNLSFSAPRLLCFLWAPRHTCRDLRQLAIIDCVLSRESPAALCPLSGLTALYLPACGIQALPHGPYLLRLLRCGQDLPRACTANICCCSATRSPSCAGAAILPPA